MIIADEKVPLKYEHSSIELEKIEEDKDNLGMDSSKRNILFILALAFLSLYAYFLLNFIYAMKASEHSSTEI